MKMLNVMYMCDNAFAPLAGISMTSLFINNPKTLIRVYLLGVNISAENSCKFQKLADKYYNEINIIDATSELKEIEKLGLALYRGSSLTNLRLYFERLIPFNIERLLYIDCDTIICNSLEQLFNYDIHEKMLGMVLDAYADLINVSKPMETAYYNAGVILINCKKWREEKWENRIVKFINEKKVDYSHPDQDIYNIVCKDEIFRLPIKYNFQPVHKIYSEKCYFRYLSKIKYYSEYEIKDARENPYIIHLIRVLGENPWHFNNKHPYKKIFDYYRLESNWRDYKKKRVKFNLVIKVERFLYRILPKDIFFPVSLLGMKIMRKFLNY